MAQLIKIQDYISRYEMDLVLYTNRFVQLKQQRWSRRKEEWKAREEKTSLSTLKEKFLDDIFHFQLRWASSTIHSMSSLHPKYENDERLHFLVTKLPDNYLLMYEPVFQVKNAPVELEIILIGPASIYCLSYLSGEAGDIFQARNDKFWLQIRDNEERKVISPILALKRMETIIRHCLKPDQTHLPLKKVILAPTSYVDFFQPSKYTECYDRRTFHQWHHRLVNDPSPLKHLQFKAAHQLLDCCQTYAYARSFDNFPGN